MLTGSYFGGFIFQQNTRHKGNVVKMKMFPRQMFSLSRTDTFEKHRLLLRDRLDTDFGLLDQLQTSRVLINEEKVRITAAGTTFYDRNDALINYIVKSKADKLNKICQALRESSPTQGHLVNFLEKDGGKYIFIREWC